MGRIKGHYEWDDDDLTPGQKSEGGLHQNLYNRAGKLKGSARFVPDDGAEPEPLIVTETVYVPVEERRGTREEEELQKFINDLVARLVLHGIASARPYVAQWLRETARPAFDAKRARLSERRARRKERKQTVGVQDTVVEPTYELEGAVDENRPTMSSAEAQARLLAALAAQAYSEEQMRLVNGANIVDGEGMAGLKRALAKLPPDQVKGLIEAMATDPSMLGEDTLAQIASLLGRERMITRGS